MKDKQQAKQQQQTGLFGLKWSQLENIAIIVGLLLRFCEAGTPELWRDQAFSVRAAMFPVDGMLSVVKKDTAPFLHYVILHYWIQLFGFGELSVRMPSILAGCVSILVFKRVVSKSLNNPRTRFFAVALYCSNPQVLYYDQMARVYSIVMMLVIILYSVLLSFVNKTETLWTYFQLLLSTVLGLYSFNLFPFVSFPILVFSLSHTANPTRLKILLTYFLSGLVYLPLFINLTIKQFNLVRESHLPFYFIVSLFIIFVPLAAGERPPCSTYKIDIVVRLSAYIMAGVLMFQTVVLWVKENGLSIGERNVRILTGLLGVILLEIYGYSVKTSVASPRYLLFLVPILCILLAELYRNKLRVLTTIIFLTLFASVYQCKVGYVYRGDMKAMIGDIQFKNKTLLLTPDGVSYHTLKFYISHPIYVYDPQRSLPYYDGVAIFQEEDYYDKTQFQEYNQIYVPFFRDHPQLSSLLTNQCFRRIDLRSYQGDYNIERWARKPNCK